MMITSVSAQRINNTSMEARILTDKMTAELGLNSWQREKAYQMNLSYLNGINSYRDIDSHIWKIRNNALKGILNVSQWKLYKNASYFYRPISWRSNAYVHNIYAKYPKQKNWRKDGPRPACDPRPGHGPRPDFKGKPGPDFKKGKPDFKKGKPGKHDRPSFGNGRREW